MEEKTVLQWLEQAKAEGYEWADAAIANAMMENDYNDLARSMSRALECAFFWDRYEQSRDYWVKIHSDLKEKGL